MPWVRFDDAFPIHRKVDGLSDAAFRLHVSAIFWCARNLTDGVVPKEDLELVTARVRTPERFAADLVRRGVWHEPGYVCESEDCPAFHEGAGGWTIHDYLEFQPSKERVHVERRSNADRQKAWRERQKSTKRNAVTNDVSNGPSNTAPSRPVPKTDSSSLSGTQTREDGHEQDPDDTAEGTGTSTTRASSDGGRGTRLPDDFPLAAEMIAWARENTPTCGISDHDAFCDYWRAVPGAKGKKLDWISTWRNWMRKEHKDRVRHNGKYAPGSNPHLKPDTGPIDPKKVI